MKSAFIAILLFGVLATVLAHDKEAFRAQFRKCIEDEKVEPEDLEDMKATHEINTEGTKRLWHCMYTAQGIMKEDKFDKEGYVTLIETRHGEDEDKDKRIAAAKEIAEACDGKVGAGGATPEETTKMIHDCLREEAKSREVRAF